MTSAGCHFFGPGAPIFRTLFAGAFFPYFFFFPVFFVLFFAMHPPQMCVSFADSIRISKSPLSVIAKCAWVRRRRRPID
jgi:hypothetical protein